MKKTTSALLLLFCGIFLTAGAAPAAMTAISPTSNLLTPGGILDTLYGLGNIDRINDDFDQIWNPADGNASAQAKFANFGHKFGYIPDTDGDGDYTDENWVSLFSIAHINDGGPSGYLSGTPQGNLSAGSVNFIWRLDPDPGSVLTSLEPNYDGIDHMVTWLITGGPSAGNHVIAWEDLKASASNFDGDYNDLVVEVTVAAPVPIPGAVLLLGSGLVALAGIRRRFQR